MGVTYNGLKQNIIMFSVEVNKEFGRIVVRTDDPSVKYMFESVIQEKTYVRKNWIMLTKNIKIYRNQNDIKDDDGNFIFILNYGWASYILRVFKSYLSVSDYNGLVRLLMSDTVRTIPFPGLRDYQNSDVLHLLRYRISLCSCYTSYGGSDQTLKLNKTCQQEIRYLNQQKS